MTAQPWSHWRVASRSTVGMRTVYRAAAVVSGIDRSARHGAHRSVRGNLVDEGVIEPEDLPEIQEWLAQKDREWLDLEGSALDGKTPRRDRPGT